MYPTTARYKDMVYSVDYARHFVPEVILKVIDTLAKEQARYTANSSAFFTDFKQLTDDNTVGMFRYGTLEDFQFLLDGSKYLMPSRELTNVQLGFSSEAMTDASGMFSTPVELNCAYDTIVRTVGRTLQFDTSYDAVPKDFDLVYSNQGTELKTVKVTNNVDYMVISAVGVEDYDMLTIRVYSMTKPYRRVHIVEDVPGIYFVYGRNEIISINANISVDLFMRDLITGEIDFQVENAKKTLDILNPEGFEQYLKKRQPVEINLIMIFPDGSQEKVPLGNMLLTDWKSQKGALTASFTARDCTDKLAQDEYVKGTIPATPVALSECAETVLKDAGITEYEIDTQFTNIYTTAPLPIGTHKELLRLIAQAGQGAVIPTVTGGIHLKYISPLLTATNNIKNANFDNGFDNWQQVNCSLDTSQLFHGKQSVLVPVGGSIAQTVSVASGHKIYYRVYLWTAERLSTGTATITINDEVIGVDLVNANIPPNTWSMFSVIVDSTESSNLKFSNDASTFNVDSFMAIDLTLTYGEGNEPDKKWCDSNIRFFTATLNIPRVSGPAPVDVLDNSILIESPEIALATAYKSVETNIYSYIAATENSDVYDGQRYIAGTEEFIVKFNHPAKDCTVTVTALTESGEPASSNTATLVSSELYAQAAKLKVTAAGNVQIQVSGREIKVQSTSYKIDNVADVNLVAEAKAQVIDNKLITNKTTAEDVAGYAAYWYNKRYDYNFDWRQNPAIQVLDTVVVQDDFNKNNPVLLLEQNIDYTDGVLGGSSKGVY